MSAPTIRDLLKARAAPWNEVSPVVIEAILEAITDKGLLEAVAMRSMQIDLVARYAKLGAENHPAVIRAQVSQILCDRGTVAVGTLSHALKAGRKDLVVDI